MSEGAAFGLGLLVLISLSIIAITVITMHKNYLKYKFGTKKYKPLRFSVKPFNKQKEIKQYKDTTILLYNK